MSLCNLLNWGLPRCQGEGSFWLPPPQSYQAPGMHDLFQFLLVISTFFFLLIVVLMGVFVVVYRRRPHAAPRASPSHNTPLEIVWTGIPVAIVVILFYRGFTGYLDLRTAPQGARQIRVTGRQWQWQFEYPNGYLDPELHVPVDEPVLLTMTSVDVIHSLSIPTMGVRMDVVPGRYSQAWFRAREAGSYDLVCSEYCGQSHADMATHLIVHPPGEYETWLHQASEKTQHMSPVDRGKMLYNQNSCWQCHTTDGKPGNGPTFQGIYGRPVQLQDGASVMVDDNYIRQHVFEPGTQVVKGYPVLMQSYKGTLSDKDVTALIEFIKSLK